MTLFFLTAGGAVCCILSYCFFTAVYLCILSDLANDGLGLLFVSWLFHVGFFTHLPALSGYCCSPSLRFVFSCSQVWKA